LGNTGALSLASIQSQT